MIKNSLDVKECKEEEVPFHIQGDVMISSVYIYLSLGLYIVVTKSGECTRQHSSLF